MTRRRFMVIALAALAVIVLGVGLGLHFSGQPGFQSPEGQPAVFAEELYTMQGVRNTIYLYGDGTVVRVTDTGLRMATQQNPAVRTWYRGEISPAELDDLLNYFREIDFNSLAVPPFWNGEGENPTPSSDLMYTLSISSGDLQRTLTVSSYFPPTHTGEGKVMPAPLDDVYQRLATIADGAEKIYSEKLYD